MKKLNKFTYKFLAPLIIILSTISSITYAKESNVLSAIAGDWNQDKRLDAAVLMKNNDIVEIYIFLADKKNKLQTVLYKKDIVWMGSMEGTQPYLEAKEKRGSLLIMAGNDSIGRNRWFQILTTAYREKTFMISGYTYESRDTLSPNSFHSCDVNLFTGKGFRDKETFKITGQKIKLKDWSADNIPAECTE
jgi:hypothetical protein